MNQRILVPLVLFGMRALAQDEAQAPPPDQGGDEQQQQQPPQEPADELTEARQQISELQGLVQAQQQQLDTLGTRLDELTQASNQNADVLDQAVERQQAAEQVEGARVGRVRGVDELLDLAAQIDLALMGGNRDVEPALIELENGLLALQQQAAQISGREETDDYSGAINSLEMARQSLQDGDLFWLRGYVAGAAGDFASGRNSAAGNPQRAWAR